MKKTLIACLLILVAVYASAQKTETVHKIEKDSFPTTSGILGLHFIGHGSLMISFNDVVIHIDPSMLFADYSKAPKANLVLITHHHSDHLDTAAISRIYTNGTQIILPQASQTFQAAYFEKLRQGTVMANGEKLMFYGAIIEAVPAYNITPGKEKYHPKGRDNGYVITIDGKRIYIAGDTENIPEMASLKDIDIAFLPMNQPYTMTPEQVASAVNSFNPKIFYPYHYGDSDIEKLKKLLSKNKKTEVRIRALK